MLCLGDTFIAVHKDQINYFPKHLNRQNADMLIEENGKNLFMDCLVTRDNNKVRTMIYRKLTPTDRLLEQLFYGSTSQKATTIRALKKRAQYN